jgi:hypothetical protein
MAVCVIEQKPIYSKYPLPVGSDIIFTISNDTAVANETKVKFCVGVYISNGTPANIAQTANLRGTFKVTPNNAGVGIFDLSKILETYCKADNLAGSTADYKGQGTTEKIHPMHIIDKYSRNVQTVRSLALEFYVEYLQGTAVAADPTTAVPSDGYLFYNGYLKATDVLDLVTVPYSGFNMGDFGYNLVKYVPAATAGSSTKRYLTNAPTTQYANDGDYGTLAFFTPNQTAGDAVAEIQINYFTDSGLHSSETVERTSANGAYLTWGSHARDQMLFFGCFPGNLENWSTTYLTARTAGLTYYTISAQDSTTPTPNYSLRLMTIVINCPDLKNYEPIRLCWLNQFGAWDYYTFTKKSIRNTSTQQTTYTQLSGTWNSNRYRLQSFRGGKKTFRTNATERITINTDFVSEDFNVMFEELTNSPEVYLLEGYQTDSILSALNQYVTPVRLTTSTFQKKTKANDRLIQYTFEIEKSKTLRTQSV